MVRWINWLIVSFLASSEHCHFVSFIQTRRMFASHRLLSVSLLTHWSWSYSLGIWKNLQWQNCISFWENAENLKISTRQLSLPFCHTFKIKITTRFMWFSCPWKGPFDEAEGFLSFSITYMRKKWIGFMELVALKKAIWRKCSCSDSVPVIWGKYGYVSWNI